MRTTPLSPPATRRRPAAQGFTLVELLVGLAIGLIVVAAALAVLMAARAVTGSVDDLSNMQQQASYVMRVIGAQVRSASALSLNTRPADANDLTPSADAFGSADNAFTAAAFETRSGDFDLADTARLLNGHPDSGFDLVVGYSNHPMALFPDGATSTLIARDCLGASPSSTLIQSHFRLDTRTHQLRCASTGAHAGAQALANRVADFQIRYLVQHAAASGAPLLQYRTAAAVDDWTRVQALEVCLALYGAEPVDLPPGAEYTGCTVSPDGTFESVDMATLPGERRQRLHRVFRHVFQLRSHGLQR